MCFVVKNIEDGFYYYKFYNKVLIQMKYKCSVFIPEVITA